MTGKHIRNSADSKSLDRDLKILAYEVTFYQTRSVRRLSPPVLERTLFHCTNS